MQIVSFTSVRPTMGETRTYEDFSKFLGKQKHCAEVKSQELLETLQNYFNLFAYILGNQQPSLRFKSLLKVQRLTFETNLFRI